MKTAKERMQEILEHGQARVGQTLAAIGAEFQARQDLIVKPNALDYEVKDGHVALHIGGPGQNYEVVKLTQHSESQLFDRTGVPAKYAEKLIKLGEHNLLLDNLKKMAARQLTGGALVRRVNDVAKGFLSPAYRRMDGGLIIESYVQAALRAGLVPYDGMNTDYRQNIRFLLPEIWEPSEFEAMLFGLSLMTGDYGGVALLIEEFIIRMWCTNGAIGLDLMRQVHIGQRISTDEDLVVLSDKTKQLDAETVASMISDVVGHAPAHIEKVRDLVDGSMKREPNARAWELVKKGLNKEQFGMVEQLYKGVAGPEVLPQQNSLWRLSNAVSFLAKSAEGDARLDAEALAFKLLEAPKN